MDWTAGYASDVEYTASFRPELNPAHLSFACLLHGFEPVPVDRPYTYIELGFGRGLTVTTLAATNPHGRFYAADFNPAQVAGAMHLASAAKLDNLTLLEASFEDLAQGRVADLPQFDFITLHGVYTWVNAENRQHIVNFIARYLKPGGIVYVSYNAMPGWSSVLPLQRLLVEYADLHAGRSDARISDAARFATRLEEEQAAYFVANPAAKPRLNLLQSADPRYLVHEYLHRHWEPLYHIDVARDLSAAKLDFIGAAELAHANPQYVLPPDKQALIDQIADPALRETCKDYLLNTAFRMDVFVRGARRVALDRRSALMQDAGLALIVPRDQVHLDVLAYTNEFGVTQDVCSAVLDALAIKPHTFRELAALPQLADISLDVLLEMAMLLCRYKADQAVVYFDCDRTQSDAAHRLNRALVEDARYRDDYQALASPLAGSAVPASRIERLVILCLLEQGGDASLPSQVDYVWQIVKKQGLRLARNGNTVETEEENLAELGKCISEIVESRLGLWRQLKMLPVG